MRVAVMGAGSIGGYFGGMLSRGGNQVTLIARGAHLDSIHRNGLKIVTDEREFVVRCDATDDPGEVGEVDLALFTNVVQVVHLFQVAEREGLADGLRQAFRRVVIASIGPTASTGLREYGLEVDLEAQHPRMGYLVKEAAEAAATLLDRKRQTGA